MGGAGGGRGRSGGSGPRNGDGSGLSQHPDDRLIRELIQTRRAATFAEIQQIRDRLVTAQFDPRTRDVPRYLQGRTIDGHVLGDRGDSLLLHLAQRIDEGQWSEDTTRAGFVGDLQRAANQERTRFLIYRRRGGSIAAMLAETALAAERRGPNMHPFLFVAYSADRGTLITGYQVPGTYGIALPEVVRWLT